MSVGDLLIGWLLLRQAEVAVSALDGDPSAKDVPFYQGKIGAAHFFANTVLPELSARRAVVERADNTLMELSEAAF
jgi:Acetyl-CoA dehydrogenase C-terminal like